MKMTKGAILSIVALASAGLLSPAGADAQTGRLRGMVVDARTGAPVEAAVARVGERSTGTAADGRFELCRLPAGEVRLEVAATGFARVDTLVGIDPASPGDAFVVLRRYEASDSTFVIVAPRSPTPAHQALFIVDGVRVFYSASGCEEPPPGVPVLEHVDPDDIETVQIMKGPAAVERYGPDAAYGAILITTRRARAGEP